MNFLISLSTAWARRKHIEKEFFLRIMIFLISSM